jgi:glutaredoxin
MIIPTHKARIRGVLITLIVLTSIFTSVAGEALAAEAVRLHFFMSRQCPHCKKEKAFLAELQNKYPELEVVQHSVTDIPAEAQMFVIMSAAYGVKVSGVPASFIGHFPPIIGFDEAATTGSLIESRVKYCSETGCIDPEERMRERLAQAAQASSPDRPMGLAEPTDKGATAKGETRVVIPNPGTEAPDLQVAADDMIRLPMIGTVRASEMALPVLTIAIAGLDGFNPCAFFVLFTLLGMLVHVHSRSRMLLVGGIFVFFSGFIYFIFMAAWLNIFLISGEVKIITVAAGLVALVIAVINIKDYFFFKRGVSLSIPDSAKPKLFDRMRRLLKASSLVSIIVGTVVLAVAANAYELLCTAGFPMVFTRVLTLHELSSASYYLYLVFYNVVYVVPLASIVVIFTVTLGSRKLSEHQGQALKLISGMMMLYLALMILLKPALLGNIAVAGGLLVAALASSGLLMLAVNALHGRK